MTPLILTALIAGIPVATALILRVNSLYLFLSISSGYLLNEFIGETAGLTTRSLIKSSQSETITSLVLFALPIVLTLLFMRKSLVRRQFAFQIVPLVGNGFLILVLVMPMLSVATQATIKSSELGDMVYKLHDIVVAFVVVSHLLLLWFLGKPPKKSKHH